MFEYHCFQNISEPEDCIHININNLRCLPGYVCPHCTEKIFLDMSNFYLGESKQGFGNISLLLPIKISK